MRTGNEEGRQRDETGRRLEGGAGPGQGRLRAAGPAGRARGPHRPRGHRLRQASRSGHRAAVVRRVVGADDDLAGNAEDHPLCGLQRPANDGRLRQRRDETGRQADGHAGQQPPLHAAGHSARADPRASPATITTSRAVRSGPFPRPFTWKAGPCIGNCGCGTWAGRRRPRTASACSSGG